jgi:hypothetical protein
MRSWRSSFGRWCLGAALCCAAAGADAATTLYKWVDANGVTHYSDRPEPGAERIKVASAQTYKSGPAPRADQSRAQPYREAPRAGYTHLEIMGPADGAVLWNTGGHIDVSATLEPDLASVHQLWFVLDGKSQQAPPDGNASLEVVRGEHTLVATVTDSAGNELISSAPVSFVVRQKSIEPPPQGPSLPKPKPKP